MTITGNKDTAGSSTAGSSSSDATAYTVSGTLVVYSVNSVTLSGKSGASSGWPEPMVICGTDH